MAEKIRVEEVKRVQTFVYPPLEPGQKVYCGDGYAGKVVALRPSPEKKHQSFVVETGMLFRHRYIVPCEWLDRIEADRVYLSAKKDDLRALPEERPDPILVIEVKRALREEAIVRGAEIKDIHVSARQGFINLDGYVPDPAQKARAENAARQIPGILEVENGLVTDEELKRAVASAVAQIFDSSEDGISVSAQRGYITLSGNVSSVEARMAAETQAGSVPQIRGVLNTLRVPNLAVEFPEPRALQPSIGARIHATDLALGHVEQVIVNGVNRLVTAILVDGMFSEPRGNRRHSFFNDVIVRRKAVIPVHAIQQLTDTGVFLEGAASQFEDFDSENFVAPDSNWQPPYPYQHKDVLVWSPAESEQGNSKMVGMSQISKVLA
jgi:osmotically-inducible protein OsmY